jgi:hypothetical protein
MSIETEEELRTAIRDTIGKTSGLSIEEIRRAVSWALLYWETRFKIFEEEEKLRRQK